MRVIVIGGLGNFGARICRRLQQDPLFTVFAASRHSSGAPHTDADGWTVATVKLDIEAPDFEACLLAAKPDLVIHCAGPFQGQSYRVPLAACAAGAHYLDIADGRDFVADFASAVNSAATAANVCAISGASSVPGLSSAVVDELCSRFSRLDSISIGIAPGQQAPRGVATIKAVFGYAGAPIRRWKNGHWGISYGWQDIHTLDFADLGKRWGAACDVPDLALFPARYPSAQTVEFHAALELRSQHVGLWAAAALRRIGIKLPIARYAAQLDRLATVLLDRFGTDRGGMQVRVSGLRLDGQPGAVSWHLTAPGGDGPEIPCMSTLLLAAKLARQTFTQVGAQPCLGLLKLAEFEPEFQRWGFTTHIIEHL